MPDGTIAVIAPLAAGKERGEFVMADEKDGKSRTAAAARGRARSARAGALVSVVREEPEQAVEVPAQTRSGVVPVLFSASAEAHDVAVVAPEQGADWRSPFGAPLRHASGE
ncbi:hypothetical protein [Amycolatopsis silviterrae]|uniref:Flp pilus assembly protein RcpC/CpaB domain-containing protein n=1 Tax=Amycolatopsis silviterrae TaxID=1656914 RepID=A0ABW5H1I4_9PSEU